MSRRLGKYLNQLTVEIEEKPYEYWAEQEFPITYETMVDGKEVQVEIGAHDITPESVLIYVDASDSPLGWWIRKSVTIIIRRAG